MIRFSTLAKVKLIMLKCLIDDAVASMPTYFDECYRLIDDVNSSQLGELIDDVNSSQLGEAQHLADLAVRSINRCAARHSNASRYKARHSSASRRSSEKHYWMRGAAQ